MLLATNVDKKPLLPSIDQAVKSLFHDPADAFFTGRAMDIMFGGVLVDCTGADKLTMAVCMTIAEESAFKRVDEGHLAFSMFGGVSAFLCDF